MANGPASHATRSAHGPDFDADGLADFADCPYGDPPSLGRAATFHVVYGGAKLGERYTAFAVEAPPGDPRWQTRYSCTALDVDEDGYDDLVVGVYRAFGFRGRVDVYRGGRRGISTQRAFSIDAPADSVTFGLDVWDAGDLDHDGHHDLAVHDQVELSTAAIDDAILGAVSGLRGRIQLYRRARPDARPDATIAFGSSSGPLASIYSLAGLGDVDGDGIDDIAVAWEDEVASRTDILLGERGRFPARPHQTLRAARGHIRGFSIAAAGDMDGDRRPDFALGLVGPASADHDPIPEGIEVVRGGAIDDQAAPMILHAAGDDQLGREVHALGDFDGDGYADIAATRTTANDGGLVVFFGAPDGLTRARALELTAVGRPIIVAAGLDLDGDGRDDIVSRSECLALDHPCSSELAVYFGAPRGQAVRTSRISF